jgi:hypothetical protein
MYIGTLDFFSFEMGCAPASASVDAHSLLLVKRSFKVYNSNVIEDRYKNQPSKNKKKQEKAATQMKHHIIS